MSYIIMSLSVLLFLPLLPVLPRSSIPWHARRDDDTVLLSAATLPLQFVDTLPFTCRL